MKQLKTGNKIYLEVYNSNTTINLSLQLVENGISAGFPSPADDFLDASIDLNKTLIKNKDAL